MIALSVLLLLVFMLPESGHVKHYDLDAPDKILILPDALHEISGVTFIDEETVACVQDENGILFIYDISENKITDQYPFHADGDYEGIARKDESIFILRSDGKIYEIKNFETDLEKVKSYKTNVPADNNEGLCFDKKNEELLIGCKNKIDKKNVPKDTRQIYSFNLDKKKLGKHPVFEFDEDDVQDFAEKHKVEIPGLTSKKDNAVFKFNISAIAIHPVNNKLFVLDAADHLLFVLDRKSNIDDIELLDTNLFNKPEGITFNQRGDMFVTNEGQEGKARLLVFERK